MDTVISINLECKKGCKKTFYSVKLVQLHFPKVKVLKFWFIQ